MIGKAAEGGHMDRMKTHTIYAMTEETYNWEKTNGCPVGKENHREKLENSLPMIGHMENTLKD